MRAFSLIELSIVLVILGLLTGGILAGQSLIRAAELRSITNDLMRYTTSVGSFRDKYFALPGDMTNATKFWGTAAACPGTVGSTDATTCDGNGNGWYETHTTTYGNEWFRFWQHLANAGLVEGSYSGIAGGSGTTPALQPVLGANVPRSRINNAGYSIHQISAVPADGTLFFIGPMANVLFFGSVIGNSTGGDAIAPQEAWNIDTKMDDGIPSTGRINSTTSTNANGGTDCATTNVASTAQYDLAKTGNTCMLVYWMFGK